MASTKILFFVGLAPLTFIAMVGDDPKQDAYGPLLDARCDVRVLYRPVDGVTGRFLRFFSVMVFAAFSIAGPDLPALAAGDSEPSAHYTAQGRASLCR